jgi:16S rRNA processing protein RimM
LTELVEIGRVKKAHGLLGEVGIKLHYSHSEALFQVEEVELDKAGTTRRLRVEGVRATPKGLLVKFAGIDDRDAAEALQGAGVSVPRSALSEPGEGEYYLSDLVGLRVIGPEGELGTVIDVRVHPSVDSAIIADASGKRYELPLVEAWLDEVDLEARVVRLSSTDGLVE